MLTGQAALEKGHTASRLPVLEGRGCAFWLHFRTAKAALRADAARFLPFGFVFPHWTLQLESKLKRKYFGNQQTKGGKIPGCHPKHGVPAGSGCVGIWGRVVGM